MNAVDPRCYSALLTVHSSPQARRVKAPTPHTRARHLCRIRGTPSTHTLPSPAETNVTAPQPYQPRHRRVIWPLRPVAHTSGRKVRGSQRPPVLFTRVSLSPLPSIPTYVDRQPLRVKIRPEKNVSSEFLTSQPPRRGAPPPRPPTRPNPHRHHPPDPRRAQVRPRPHPLADPPPRHSHPALLHRPPARRPSPRPRRGAPPRRPEAGAAR